MKIAVITLVVTLIVLAGAWSVVGWLPVRGIEQPAYEVVERRDGYEIREYAPMIVAEATNEGSLMGTMNSGFRDVADYIFGKNAAEDKIAMTSPVLHEPANPEQPAAMARSGAFTTGFVMPSKYAMEELPAPASDDVRLREVPRRRVAAFSLRGYQTEARADNAASRLVKLVEGDGMKPAGPVTVAMYDVPWAPPWMMESDVMVPLEAPQSD